MTENFNYSYSHKWSEKEYVEARSIFAKDNRVLRVVLIGIIGILFLFCQYTLILGILMLVLTIIALYKPSLIVYGARQEFRSYLLLRYTLTYRVSDSGLSVEGENGFYANCNWENHTYCKEDRGWIILTGTGMPLLFFPTTKVKQDGVYDSIMEYVKKYSNRDERNKF